MEEKTSTLSNAMIWFGAGISIAEILTGTFIAPLGFKNGFLAILLGHIIGCALMLLAGLIGAKTEKSSMDTVKMSFGKNGAIFFSALNILQLVGWTAIMIVNGAAAITSVTDILSQNIWALIIGALILLWIFVGVKGLDILNAIAITALFILTVILSSVIFRTTETVFVFEEQLSFGAAVELSVAMPLSWLPLISDYTKNAKKPICATITSTATYFIASMWMYVIGLGAAIFTGESDIAQIMQKAGLGLAAVIIVIFSTVTTTFLDVYSAGVSSESIFAKLKQKPVSIIVCIIGTILAIAIQITKFEGFLYLIGSVFAPMIAILITDFFILKKDNFNKSFDITNIIIWIIGFVIYRWFMKIDTPVGCTLPAMAAVVIIAFITGKIKQKAGK